MGYVDVELSTIVLIPIEHSSLDGSGLTLLAFLWTSLMALSMLIRWAMLMLSFLPWMVVGQPFTFLRPSFMGSPFWRLPCRVPSYSSLLSSLPWMVVARPFYRVVGIRYPLWSNLQLAHLLHRHPKVGLQWSYFLFDRWTSQTLILYSPPLVFDSVSRVDQKNAQTLKTHVWHFCGSSSMLPIGPILTRFFPSSLCSCTSPVVRPWRIPMSHELFVASWPLRTLTHPPPGENIGASLVHSPLGDSFLLCSLLKILGCCIR